jgi:phage shock protein C
MGSKIYLSDTDKKVGGVCGGLGEYFKVDATLIRLLWIVISFIALAGIGGLFLYVVCWAIIPQKPKF